MPQHLMQMTSNAEPPSHHCNVPIACCSAGGLAPGLQCVVAASSILQSGMRPLVLHTAQTPRLLAPQTPALSRSVFFLALRKPAILDTHATEQQVLSEPLSLKLCMFWVR